METGDMLFTSGHSVLNKMTKVLTRHRHEPKTIATHQGMFYDEHTVQEALGIGVVRSDWDQYQLDMAASNTEWCVMRFTGGLSEHMKTHALFYMDEMLGWRYSRAELFLCALDGILGKLLATDIILFRKLDLFRRRVICSKTSNRVFVKLEVLPRQAYYWVPDDTLDYTLGSTNFETVDRSAHWPEFER